MHTFSLELFLPTPTNKIDFQTLQENTHLLPNSPGVYVFEREEGDYSYSGRAESLRKRLRDHLKGTHNEGLKKDIEEGNIQHYFYFLCDTELDAIVLERYFIQGGYYRGEHNVQYVKEDALLEDDSELSKEEYALLLQEEKEALEQMLKEDEVTKIRLFEKFTYRIQNKVDNIHYIGRKHVQEVYAKELFIFLFNYIRYTKHTNLNWTHFKAELEGKISKEMTQIVDQLCQSKAFRHLLKPLDKTNYCYTLGKYKFEIRKEVGKDIYYFDYTAPSQYNKITFAKGHEERLTPKKYVEKYIK